ncbi:hypothetical protein F5146DRAFT_1009822 [Armillaria mellea]|nr:hypothetical protein F5146DRAFT_1009818 [Armillaria mellea]KAK0183572.1 hypothetical protein F5146DRAFT_1009822 [Armillaria mellea]
MSRPSTSFGVRTEYFEGRETCTLADATDLGSLSPHVIQLPLSRNLEYQRESSGECLTILLRDAIGIPADFQCGDIRFYKEIKFTVTWLSNLEAILRTLTSLISKSGLDIFDPAGIDGLDGVYTTKNPTLQKKSQCVILANLNPRCFVSWKNFYDSPTRQKSTYEQEIKEVQISKCTTSSKLQNNGKPSGAATTRLLRHCQSVRCSHRQLIRIIYEGISAHPSGFAYFDGC